MSKLVRNASIAVAALLVMAVASGVPASARPEATGGVPTTPRLAAPRSNLWSYVQTQVPTTADCVAGSHLACYAPSQIQEAYDLNDVYTSTGVGEGQTIAVVDSFGSPTIKRDLKKFNMDFHLPNTGFQIIHPAGSIPSFHPTAERIGWAFETTLDVEWAHAIAPGATILLVETPVNETQGQQGLPQIMKAENFVINHGLADVISQSFGTSEADFANHAQLLGLRSAFKSARDNDVTVLASSGDTGATGYTLRGGLFTHPAPQWPASDPLVTAVGGTQLHLKANGDRKAPDNVWNDTFNRFVVGRPPVPTAAGGGMSTVFARPDFQDSIHAFSANRRAYPDVSLSAAVNGGVLVYLSFGGLHRGYYIVGGTSEASPEFAGIVALANEAAGHDLGFLDPALYDLHSSASPGLVDITKGNNLVRFRQMGKVHTVKGFKARPGFDLASGLGTVDGFDLVQALSAP